MRLSIIIVNWNSAEFTKGCIDSIRSTVRDFDYEIIVVDNASEDDSRRSLSAIVPPIELICPNENLGFARANNLGFAHSHGENVLFLNPDTVVLDNAIQGLAASLVRAPGIGAVGCKLLNSDLSLQTTCVQPFPNILNQVFGMDWLKRRLPGLPLWGMQALYSRHPDRLQEVAVISGACMMLTRAAFEASGGFCSELYMYGEEADLCYKLRCSGFRVCYDGNSRVVHFGGQSTSQRGTAFREIAMRESVFALLQKVRGRRYAQLYRGAMLLSAIARLTILWPMLLTPVRRASALHAFMKWRAIAGWCVTLRGVRTPEPEKRPDPSKAIPVRKRRHPVPH